MKSYIRRARARSRAELCRQQIVADGQILKTNRSLRSHPLIREELASRAFVVSALARLGFDLEPLRDRPGRP